MSECRRSLRFLIGATTLLATALVIGEAAACESRLQCGCNLACDAVCDCVDGECVYARRDCNDGDPCTVDPPCDPTFGCVHPDACPNDGRVCNGDEYCCSNPVFCIQLCQVEPPPDCDDDDDCTIDSQCTEPFGCSHVARNCDDGNPCTSDSCDPTSGCVHAAIVGCCRTGADCQGDACVEGRSCVGLACTAGVARPCDDADPCTTDSCDAATGCLHAPVAGCCRSDTDCGAARCVTGRACTAGTCTAGAPRACDDGDPCTVDSCADATGCVRGPRAGFGVLGCVCERMQPAPCTDQPLPRSLDKRVRRACRSIALSEGAAGRKRDKLLGRAITQFTKATTVAARVAARRGVSEACGNALTERFADNRTRAVSVRNEP